MNYKMKDVLRKLDEFHAIIGFENLTEEDLHTIYDAQEPFIIKKSEWKRALMLGMNMPKRTIDEWWSDFKDLDYLRPLKLDSRSKSEEALLNINVIKRDLDAFYGSGAEDCLEE